MPIPGLGLVVELEDVGLDWDHLTSLRDKGFEFTRISSSQITKPDNTNHTLFKFEITKFEVEKERGYDDSHSSFED